MKIPLLIQIHLFFSFALVSAQNKKPVISGPFNYTVTAEHSTCIDINTYDPDPGDSTFVYWINSIPFASWESNNGIVKRAQGTICFFPYDADASTLPYLINFYVTDKKDTVFTQIRITVNAHIKGNRNFINKGMGAWDFRMTPVSSFFNGYTNTWYKPKLLGTGSSNTIISNLSNFTYHFSDSGTYIIRSVIKFDGHVNTYLDTLHIDSTFAPMGIEKNNMATSIIYSGNDHVKVKSPGPLSVNMVDLAGKQQMFLVGEDEIVISLNSLPFGIYLLYVRQNDKVEVLKITRY